MMDPIQLEQMHIKAQQYLEVKVSRVPKRVLPQQDIFTIYHNPPYLKNIPPDLQLPFLFLKYDDFKQANFQARRKANQDYNITRAIFYYEMDPYHSFTRRHKQVRYNLILIVLTFAAPNTYDYIPVPDTDEGIHQLATFRTSFLWAWAESLRSKGDFQYREEFLWRWATGPFDLINFTSSLRRR